MFSVMLAVMESLKSDGYLYAPKSIFYIRVYVA